ncbi:hypothetical protein E2C01_066763 [Portunus trituberculatus]|uniref:Uncharacterized protein n=1 Tax=Portunus trituberculatus TaxID=210409 RepID=A0A5B7HT76_PORTR|nr:hypothetical protein [Portunus trituberculatus]
MRKPDLHSDRGQDSNSCAWRPLRPQSTHDSTVPWRPIHFSHTFDVPRSRSSHPVASLII